MKTTFILALALLFQQGLSTSAQTFGYKSLRTREAEVAAKATKTNQVRVTVTPPSTTQVTTNQPPALPPMQYLLATPTNPVVGGQILVRWNTTNFITFADLITMVRRDSGGETVIDRKQVLLRGGDTIFAVPSSGTFEFRYFRWDGVLMMVSNPVTVGTLTTPPTTLPLRLQMAPNETGSWMTFTFEGQAGKKYRIISSSDIQRETALWESVTRVESAGGGTQRVTLPTGSGARFFKVWQE